MSDVAAKPNYKINLSNQTGSSSATVNIQNEIRFTFSQANNLLFDTSNRSFKSLRGNDVNFDKRMGMPPIPPNYEKLLTASQMVALRSIEGFGWSLKFVRREGLPVPIPVITGADGVAIGVIDEDGNINMKPDITIRD